MITLIFVLPTDPPTFREASWSAVPRPGERVGLLDPVHGMNYAHFLVSDVLYLEDVEERSCPEVYHVVVPRKVKVRVQLAHVEEPPALASAEQIQERLRGA